MTNLNHYTGVNEKRFTKTIILKIASRCNLKCTYCHWFRDENVYLQPPVIKKETYDALILKLETYLIKIPLKKISFVLHGGEPLLIKKDFFIYICEELRRVERKTHTTIAIGITTNGVLISDEWVQLFKQYNVRVAISLDGNEFINDKHRVDLKGRGTYARTVLGIRKLQKTHNQFFSLLAVCQPNEDPELLCEHFINILNVKKFDFLIPNNNHDDVKKTGVPSIANFYITLFDLWLRKYQAQGINIRIIKAFLNALHNKHTALTGIGFAPIDAIAITPSGEIEPLDVFRINGTNQVNTGLTVFNNNLEEIFIHPLWLTTFNHSLAAPPPCQQCHIKEICRGGNVVHRFSSNNGYNNPSIYCADLVKIYSHIKNKLIRFADN